MSGDSRDVRPNFKPGPQAGRDRGRPGARDRNRAGGASSAKAGLPDAETLGLLALAFVAGDEALLPRFLALTGIDLNALRERAEDPTMLGAVLDFLLAHEPDLLAFAALHELPPAAIARARRVLPGARTDD